jgi:hypothetical protein
MKILKGYFISSKTYCLVLNEKDENGKDKIVVKSKGIINSKLTEDDFINLYNGNEIYGVKSQSKKNYIDGYVSIFKKDDIKLNPDVYKKRTKIIDPITNKWIDTCPLLISKRLSLILWVNKFSLILWIDNFSLILWVDKLSLILWVNKLSLEKKNIKKMP